MSKNLSEILQEGEAVLHTCYGTTYKAFFREGYLIDEVDPALRYASPTAFANAHLERGKANGWEKCKVERDGVAKKLKDLPLLKKVADVPPGVMKLRDLIKAKAMKTASINLGLNTTTMPSTAQAMEKPKKPRAPRTSTAGAKKASTTKAPGGTGEPAKPVYVPEPEPTVIRAKVVEGTDGYMDVCSTQLVILDYFKYDGVVYYKEANTDEVFEISADKSIGPCIGIWDSESCVIKAPYVEYDDE